MRRQKSEHIGLKKCRGTVLGLLLSSVFCLLFTSHSAAAPSQTDVFKSIQDSVGEKSEFDWRPIILLIGGGGAVLLLVAVARRPRASGSSSASGTAVARPLNHPGRLMSEVLRDVPLKGAELRQLKAIAAAIQDEAGESPNALTLLLCPSLLIKGLKSRSEKIDRNVVAQVVRKMQLNQPPAAAEQNSRTTPQDSSDT